MHFDRLLTDKVSVLKADGQRIDDIRAAVQSGRIDIMRSDFLLESGDLILRKASNGAEETYRVLDPGFREKFGAIPAGYGARVANLGIQEAEGAVRSITYNITGNNARVNHGSVDNSVNVVAGNAEALELLGALRDEIGRLDLGDSERKDAVDLLDATEAQIKSGSPSRVVLSAMLKGLPHAASVATIASAILSLF